MIPVEARVRVPAREYYHCADATRKLPADAVGVVLEFNPEAAAANPIAELPYLVRFPFAVCDCGDNRAWFAEDELEEV